MKILPIIYMTYMFISMYFLILSFLLYFVNRKQLFSFPTTTKKYSISFIVPVWNEEKTVEDTIRHIYSIDYKYLKEVIAVNDFSSDNTLQILEKLKSEFPSLIVLSNEKNMGKSSSVNRGIEIARGELVAVTDADSYPAKDSLQQMVGFFDDEKVGAVTCPVLVRNAKTLLEKLQEIEYRVISFTRKLLDFVDGIYVTPGPLALYRKKALESVGNFDTKNMTEDIELTWRLLSQGWKRRMALGTQVTTTAPTKFKSWYKQRVRWSVGGNQCMVKYRKEFLKRGMLGMFVLPFFVLQSFLGVLGLGVFGYVLITRALSDIIFTKYSLSAGVPLLTIEDFFITPSFLNYLGLVLFVLGLIFSIIILCIMKGAVLKNYNPLTLFFYSLIYLAVYPFIALNSLYKYFKGNYTWR